MADIATKKTDDARPIGDEKAAINATFGSESPSLDDGSLQYDDIEVPTEEDLATLRRVSGRIPWTSMTITFVEFCERFGYYGTTQVFVNFIQQPLPPFSTTGSITQTEECYRMYSYDLCTQPGALGRGQQASTGLVTFNQFWAYIMPLFGAWVADGYLGRFNTIQWSILIAVIGHVLLIVSASPHVIAQPDTALGIFALALIVLGVGTGGFKSNISALIAEQISDRRQRIKILKSGERVIEDPNITVSRVYHYFYMMVNVGSLVGGIGMPFAERYVGFWLAYLLPTCLFCVAPVVLFLLKNKYVKQKPTYSVLSRSLKLLALASKGRWTLNPVTTYKNMVAADFWENVKPSRISNPPSWYKEIDDAWVDEVRRGYAACKVFCWLPLYWLAYNQMSNNLTSQAATMKLGGVPNDIPNNLDPFALVLLIPLMDKFFYPFLRKCHINFTPIKRITFGFFIASASMIAATVTQYYIYQQSPCGEYPSDCATTTNISVWVQSVPYVLVAISEIFASITSLEYAATKAPINMRSIVQAVALAQTAFAAAIGQALNPLATDPNLIWNYGVVAVLAAAGGVLFWLTWSGLDKEEDKLNALKPTEFVGRQRSIIGSAQVRAELAEATAQVDSTYGTK